MATDAELMAEALKDKWLIEASECTEEDGEDIPAILTNCASEMFFRFTGKSILTELR